MGGLLNLTEKGKAIWALALLSPIIAELMSGSSRPHEFFSPISFAFLVGLYGAGALIMRELAAEWRLGWFGLLVLGAAYGILEEGVAIKSFFDPEWMDLEGLGEYGRWLGTNWVWAVWLTIYHAVISIMLPIALVGFMYPRFRGERLLTRGQFEVVLLILILDVIACATLLNPYLPQTPVYVISIVAVFGLVLYARHIPRSFLMPKNPIPDWSPRRFLVLGFLLVTLCFITSNAFKTSSVPALVPILIMIAICCYVLRMIWKHMGKSHNLPQFAHLLAGVVLFLLGLNIVTALGGWYDMAFVAIFTGLLAFDLMMWSTGRRAVLFLRGREAAEAV